MIERFECWGSRYPTTWLWFLAGALAVVAAITYIRKARGRLLFVGMALGAALSAWLILPGSLSMLPFYSCWLLIGTIDALVVKDAKPAAKFGFGAFGLGFIVFLWMWGLRAGFQFSVELTDKELVQARRSDRVDRVDRKGIEIRGIPLSGPPARRLWVVRNRHYSQSAMGWATDDVFRDARGHILNGDDVAARVSRWAGVPLTLRP